MRAFEVTITDYANFEEKGPRFSILVKEIEKSSHQGEGESIITLDSDYTLNNLSPALGDKKQKLEINTTSVGRVLQMLLLLRGLSPFNEWIGGNVHRVRLLDFHVEAYTYYSLELLNIKPKG